MKVLLCRAAICILAVARSSLAQQVGPSPSPAVAVSAGAAYACLLDARGEVFCWGRNAEGQLGDGTTITRPVAVHVKGLAGVAEISAGFQHTCARLTSGSVLCWGSGVRGQLGDGRSQSSSVPVAVSGLADAVEITAGLDDSCARRAAGTVVCWGHTPSFGEEGKVAATPVPIQEHDVLHLAAGASATCFIHRGGGVSCRGSALLGHPPRIADAVAIALSRAPATFESGECGTARCVSRVEIARHACAVRRSGAVVCWGDAAFHALDSGAVRNAEAIAVAGLSSCAQLKGGGVTCWGSNGFGALGTGNSAEQAAPAAVVGLNHVTAVTAGSSHVCALQAGGRVSCWGDNAEGQLGIGISPGLAAQKAVPVGGPGDLVALSQRSTFGCAARSGGEVSCWGSNEYGQLGNGSKSAPASNLAPVEVRGIRDARRVSAGTAHACALLATGRIACWGYNHYGQLGDGSTHDSSSAVKVAGIDDATDLALNGDRSCALRRGGSVSCWGEVKEWVRGKEVRVPRPTAVPGISEATALTLGKSHACVLNKEGKVLCWGDSWPAGLFGCGDESCGRDAAIPAAGLTDAIAASASESETCALKRSGEVVCWGLNLGLDQTPSPQVLPRVVPGLTAITALATPCALKRDGTVWCWGLAAFGKKNDGAPGAIPGIANATSLPESGGLPCALVSGRAFCWGSDLNVFGGAPGFRLTPIEVLRP